MTPAAVASATSKALAADPSGRIGLVSGGDSLVESTWNSLWATIYKSDTISAAADKVISVGAKVEENRNAVTAGIVNGSKKIADAATFGLKFGPAIVLAALAIYFLYPFIVARQVR